MGASEILVGNNLLLITMITNTFYCSEYLLFNVSSSRSHRQPDSLFRLRVGLCWLCMKIEIPPVDRANSASDSGLSCLTRLHQFIIEGRRMRKVGTIFRISD